MMPIKDKLVKYTSKKAQNHGHGPPKAKQRWTEAQMVNQYLYKRRMEVQQRRSAFLPQQDIQENPAHALRDRLNEQQLKLLNKLLYYTRSYKYAYCSRERLAQETGYSIRHVQRLLDQFEALGLVGRVHRGVKRTCLYYSSPFFDQEWVQHNLRGILRCFFTLAISLLFSMVSHTGNGTQADLHGYITPCCHLPSSLYRQGRGSASVRHGTRVKNKEQGMKQTVGVMQPAVQYLHKQGQKDIRYGIPLTRKGSIKLNVFPVEVHRKVYREYTRKWRTDVIHAPFAWYMKRCLEVCDAENITPAWAVMYQQLDALGIGHDKGGEVNTERFDQLMRPHGQSKQQRSSQATQRSTDNTVRQYYAAKSNLRTREEPERPQPTDERIKEATRRLWNMRRSQSGLANQILACMPEEVYTRLQQQAADQEREE